MPRPYKCLCQSACSEGAKGAEARVQQPYPAQSMPMFATMTAVAGASRLTMYQVRDQLEPEAPQPWLSHQPWPSDW
eukprot:5014632-Lingulodinium_polyedra.AAC.1